jgi:magnesium transporter
VLAELPEGILTDLLEEMKDETISVILSRQDPSDALIFLNTIPEERHEQILQGLPEELRDGVEQLLIYPQDSCGYWMTTSFVAVDENMTANATVEYIRELGEEVDALFYVYVIEENRRLVGVLPLRRLVTCPPGTLVHDIMVEDPFTVRTEDDREEAASIARRYNIMAVPVVDENHCLKGIIPGDSLFDVMEKEATEDMYRMAGLSENDRVFTPVPSAFKRRFPWIWVNLLTAFLAAIVVRFFEGTIEAFATLAVFMPVVAGMGGNTGNQSLTVITRGIALGELEFSSGIRAVLKEGAVGLLVGAVAGIAASGAAMLMGGEHALRLGLVLFLAMVANMGLAGTLGATVPLVLRSMGRDPALGSNIILTAFTDSVGYLLFLGLALLIINPAGL